MEMDTTLIFREEEMTEGEMAEVTEETLSGTAVQEIHEMTIIPAQTTTEIMAQEAILPEIMI
jgi:hypothetical protein